MALDLDNKGTAPPTDSFSSDASDRLQDGLQGTRHEAREAGKNDRRAAAILALMMKRDEELGAAATGAAGFRKPLRKKTLKKWKERLERLKEKTKEKLGLSEKEKVGEKIEEKLHEEAPKHEEHLKEEAPHGKEAAPHEKAVAAEHEKLPEHAKHEGKVTEPHAKPSVAGEAAELGEKAVVAESRAARAVGKDVGHIVGDIAKNKAVEKEVGRLAVKGGGKILGKVLGGAAIGTGALIGGTVAAGIAVVGAVGLVVHGAVSGGAAYIGGASASAAVGEGFKTMGKDVMMMVPGAEGVAYAADGQWKEAGKSVLHDAAYYVPYGGGLVMGSIDAGLMARDIYDIVKNPVAQDIATGAAGLAMEKLGIKAGSPAVSSAQPKLPLASLQQAAEKQAGKEEGEGGDEKGKGGKSRGGKKKFEVTSGNPAVNAPQQGGTGKKDVGVEEKKDFVDPLAGSAASSSTPQLAQEAPAASSFQIHMDPIAPKEKADLVPQNAQAARMDAQVAKNEADGFVDPMSAKAPSPSPTKDKVVSLDQYRASKFPSVQGEQASALSSLPNASARHTNSSSLKGPTDVVSENLDLMKKQSAAQKLAQPSLTQSMGMAM